MMRVAILSPESLPIPATKGGAVEGLIDSIIKCNEDKQILNIDVFSIADDSRKNKKLDIYKMTSFIYFKQYKIIKLLDNMIMTFIRNVLNNKEVVGLDYIWKLYVVNKIKKELKKQDYDAVIIENALYLFRVFNDKSLYNKYKGKVVFHIHNKLSKKPPVELDGLCYKIISISDYLHNNIREYVGNSIPIRTVYNGVDTDLFSQKIDINQKNKIIKKLNLTEDCYKIVYVGRIAPEKGVRELIAAFKTIQEKNFRLILVGSCYFGSESASGFEKDIYNEIKGDKRIIQTGFVEKKDIWKYYNLADIVVLPSMWDEPLGLTMIEAQLSETPLITTKSGGIIETVDEKYSVLLERNGNISEQIKEAIFAICNNKVEWIENGKKAGRIAKRKFSEMAFYDSFCTELKRNGEK